MTIIRRVANLSTLAEAPPDVPGYAVKLAVQADRAPRFSYADAPETSTSIPNEKRRDGARWWTTTIEAKWWVGTLRLVIWVDDAPHEWSTDVLPPGQIFASAREATERLITRLIDAHAHLPWGGAGTVRSGALSELPDEPTPIRLHVAALEVGLPRLMAALARIERRPLEAINPTRARHRLERARRIDSRSVAALGRDAGLVAALTGRGRPTGVARIDVPTTHRTEAHPANRALAHELIGLRHRIDMTRSAFVAWRSARRSQRAREAERQISRLDAARDAIDGILKRPVWRHLEPAPPSPSALQVFADDPEYGEAMTVIRQLMRPAIQPRLEGLIDAHLRQVFDLWEQYVWLRVVRIVRDTVGHGWRWTMPPMRRDGLGVGPANGGFAIGENGRTRISVGNQVEFRRASLHSAETGTWDAGRLSTHQRRLPDITVEVHGHGAPRWLVLDAKFTHARYAIEADHLPVAHHYRDGLRLDSAQPEAAFLVVPAADDDALVYTDDDYRAMSRVGLIIDKGLSRSPGQDTPAEDYGPLVEWLADTVRSVDETASLSSPGSAS